MQLIDLALHVPNFLPEDFCDEMIEFYESQSEDRKFFETYSTEEHGMNTKGSGKCLEILKTDRLYEKVHAYTGDGINAWVRYIHNFGCFEAMTLHNLTRKSHKYRMIKYYDNLKINDHTDVGDTGLFEVCIRGSCTLNFSDVNDYDGGEFTLFRNKYQVKLGKGDLIVFPADAFWVHGTNPVTSGVRYAVNSFLHPDVSMYTNR